MKKFLKSFWPSPLPGPAGASCLRAFAGGSGVSMDAGQYGVFRVFYRCRPSGLYAADLWRFGDVS